MENVVLAAMLSQLARGRIKEDPMSDAPRYDFHIHTKYLGCANATMEVPAIVRECERIGVTSVGITDHLNSLEVLELHLSIRRDIESLAASTNVYFGAELNFLGCDEGFPFSREIKERCGFQFAIGGIHHTYLDAYDLKTLVDIQHRHHLKTCHDPLVDVLVHPYWLWKTPFDTNGWPWFDSVRAVPETYARELGQVARDTGTAVEINACANLLDSDRYVKEYVAYLAVIAEEGATFSVGSDAHDIHKLEAAGAAWRVVEQLDLPADRIWHPQCPPMAGPGKS